MSHKPVGRRRWVVGGLLGLGVLVNYLDRVNLTVGAPSIQKELGVSTFEIGLLLSAFGWTYGVLQIPAGLILDRYGVKPVMRISIFLWGLASFVTSFSLGGGTLFASRMLLGIAEAPGFPANAKATGYWFPRHERSLATALFDASAKFSNVIAIPVVAWLVVQFGWRGAFIATGIVSFVYLAIFAAAYRDPNDDKKLSPEERAYITDGGAVAEGASRVGLSLLGYLLKQRKVWGLSLGFGAYGYAFALFIFWLPGYLVKEMGMDIMKSAAFTTIPWFVATVSDLVIGGWLIDHLIARGHDETRVRKSIIIGGMVCGLAVIGAAVAHNPYWAIFWITISLSGLAATAPAAWSLPSLIAPRGGAATIGGMMNFCNSMSGVVAPIVTGFIVGTTQSFSLAFLVAGIVLVAGIAAFIFLLGPIRPIPDPEPKPGISAL